MDDDQRRGSLAFRSCWERNAMVKMPEQPGDFHFLQLHYVNLVARLVGTVPGSLADSRSGLTCLNRSRTDGRIVTVLRVALAGMQSPCSLGARLILLAKWRRFVTPGFMLFSDPRA